MLKTGSRDTLGGVQALRAAIDGLGTEKRRREEYISLLERCIDAKSLSLGRRLHSHIARMASVDTFISNLVIKMYGKCGSPDLAGAAFQSVVCRDSYTWSYMIAAAANNGRGSEALHWADKMSLDGVRFNEFSFVACIAGAASLGPKGLVQGRKIHARVTEAGIPVGNILGASLIGMYGKCGSVCEARAVFDAMPAKDRSLVPYTCLVTAYAQNGHIPRALEVFRSFKGDPDSVIFLSVITACSDSKNMVEDGQEIHARIKEHGFEKHPIVGSALVTMYGNFGMPSMARQAFDGITNKSVVAWNAMVTAYAQQGHRHEVMQLLRQMQGEGVGMNGITFVNALSACTSNAALRDGKWIHRQAAATLEVANDVYLATALVTMYGKCGSVEEARQVFDTIVEKNLVSWTSMVSAYAQNGKGSEALKLYKEMNSQGVKVVSLAFASVLDACANMEAIDEGREVHVRVVEQGLERDVYVGTALVDMYGKCGKLEVARDLFDGMSQDRNTVTWASMIGAYVQHGHPKEALCLYRAMDNGIVPSEATFLAVLNACAALGALEQGRRVHERVLANSGYDRIEVSVGNALVDMYGKCASLEDAVSTFGELERRNIVTWTSLMAAYSQLGLHKRALRTLRRMELEGFLPDEVTVTVALHSFSHSGKVKDGRNFFRGMEDDYGIVPSLQHYAGVVDLLARGGFIAKAEQLIENMPFEPSSVAWTALLSACKIYSSLGPAEKAAERAAELEGNSSAYILLMSIFCQRLDLQMEKKALQKMIRSEPFARCYIEIRETIHEFGIGDSYPVYKEATDLEMFKINRDMIKEGLRQPGDVEKNHPAKRALAFGLVTTRPGATIRLVKTLRTCTDCHSVMKFVSRSTGRRIILRDYSRFHDFWDGECSCGDLWDDKKGSLGGCLRVWRTSENPRKTRHMNQKLQEPVLFGRTLV